MSPSPRRSLGRRWPLASAAALAAALAIPAAAQPTAGAAPGAVGSASAAPPSASSAVPPAAAPPAAAPPAATQVRRGAPPPPAPSPAQQRAFAELEREAAEYERGAKDFRNMLTTIVRHHYEDRRRRVLTALDRELDTEKKSLDEARDEAIRRLEAFVERYSGSNADPKATPDAMFRLAALYEERARTRSDQDLGEAIKPAIRLYRRILADFPDYEEAAAVHYYLGHAYTDAGRIEEGQQAWRALVCSDRYEVKADPTSDDKIMLEPQPQDHDTKFWDDWYAANPIPLDQIPKTKARRPAPKPKPKPGAKPAGLLEEELVYLPPYSTECKPIRQDTTPGAEPRYLAEIWWQLGNFHFDQLDPKGGPYNLNRAATAYDLSLQFKKEPVYSVALYKQAWTYFKQQRYRTSIDWFVKLLHHTDEIEKQTGDAGADFRQEAYTYIAGSLTYVDLEGPPASDPYIPRNDVLDTEQDPLVAEQKMAVAIERVQDPKYVPQPDPACTQSSKDCAPKWTVEIYKSLAQEFIEITQNRNAIAMLELTIQKFPLDRDAPVMQNKIAELYDQLSRLAPEGSSAKAEYAEKALAARTKLSAYVGVTPWTDANKDDPEALETAENLAKNGLKRAAADHTNYARSFYDRATQLSDAGQQKAWIEKAIAEYRLAATAWAAYLARDEASPDAYESRYWLADAHYWIVVLQVTIERSPTAAEVEIARQSSTAVRDSNEDDKYQVNAGVYIVKIAEQVLEDEYRKFARSEGREGIERREEVKLEGEGESRKVVVDPVPAPVMATIQARDEYAVRIPPERDPYKNGMLYQFQAGDYFFVYGQFAEAKKRLQPLYEQYCGVNEWGYKAWDKLFSIAAFEKDLEGGRKLQQGKSCAVNEEDKAKEGARRKVLAEGLAYEDARKLYDEAEKMQPGPERDKKWREAAALYKAALELAPSNEGAPEAAMNGAYAYKQVGEYDKAIEMYELFISKYGNDKLLFGLKNGDPKAKPPVVADPKKYETRVKYLQDAYTALADAYILFFNYPKAAETFDKISGIEHFSEAQRREAAKQALTLYASMGDDAGVERARKRFRDLGASPKEMAEADFIIADGVRKKWDELSPDTGANQRARRDASEAMSRYYGANKGKAEAAQYVVHAAYWVAKTMKASNANDTVKWWQNTIAAFETYKRTAPQKDGRSSALGSPEAAMGAEADFTLVDDELKKKWDYESGFHRYKGDPVQVIKKYREEAQEAKKWDARLQQIIDAYGSPEWAIAALSRQGSVWDSLRTGLYNTRAPALKLVPDDLEKKLRKAEETGDDELLAKVDAIRISIQTKWREERDKELNAADELIVDRYGKSIVLSRRYNVTSAAVAHAIRRLAFLTDVVGEAKMKGYATPVKDLNYTEGMFLRMRPGQVVHPESKGHPAPLPAAVQ